MFKHAVAFWTIMVLTVIGLINSILDGEWTALIFPLIIAGLLFWFYKRPPRAFGGKQPKIKPSKATMEKIAQNKTGYKSGTTTKKRKTYPFHVIDGQKKTKNDDDLPKYH
ncbi:hypothetical protein M3231_14190 [Neobacillus mesonae]|nr:hypothetical protein [Neobacillus mesonae]